jgi:hypothetical protein
MPINPRRLLGALMSPLYGLLAEQDLD